MDDQIIKKNTAGTTKKRDKAPSKARASMEPRINKPPPEPTYPPGPETGLLRDEQQVARVEILMTKGVHDRRQLMQHLGVDDPRQMERYIERVHARWALLGQTNNLARHRGEALARLAQIERTLWARLQQREPDGTKVSAKDYASLVVVVLEVQIQRYQLLGLTDKAIERLQTSAPTIEFSRNKAAHEHMAMLAARMLELIEENLQPKDSEPDDAN